MATVKSMNPATGTVNREIDLMGDAQALDVCKSVKAASANWKDIGLEARLSYIKRLADVLRVNKAEYAKLATLEMGRVLKDSEIEIERCASLCDMYVQNAKEWLKDEPVHTEYKKSVISIDPIGVVLALMPWNFPYSQVFRCAIPAMAVGNTVVLRHSSNVPMCALAIEDSFRKAGFPENTFRTVITDRKAVSKMIKSKYVDGVSFTGSTEAGRSIAKVAANSIKKCVLELGGSNPFIVLKDADIAHAAKQAVETRMPSCGQSCSASKRFIVVNDVADEFERLVIENVRALKIGSPDEHSTNVGPLANAQQVATIELQVKDAIEKGAKIEVGGKRRGAAGCYYEPTVITGVKKNMKVMKEEVFGPVISIIRVRNEEAAIKLANDTEFGLGGSVWTADLARGEMLARRIVAGVVCVNRGSSSDNRLPFGGVKRSGIGREFSRYGMLEFANIRTVVIA